MLPPKLRVAQPPRLGASSVTEIFAHQRPRVYARALRLLKNPSDAEEATQEVFVRVLRSISGFEQESEIGTWLYRITTNYCLNLIRDQKRRAELDGEREMEPTPPLPSDELCLLRRLLSAGDEQQARAALYVHLDGLSHDEAARLLGVSRRTVGNLLERFRAFAEGDHSPDSLAA